MKKYLSSILTIILVLFLSTSVFAEGLIKVNLNGNQLNFDVQPQSINGRTMVPLRGIFEALGADVEWNADTKTVTASKEGTIISLTINSKNAMLNGQPVSLDSSAQIINGRTMVPVRFVSESMGCNVSWDQNTKTVIISSNSEKKESKQPYTASDGEVLGSELNKFLQQYGQPIKQTSEYDEFVEGYFKELSYKFGKVSFISWDDGKTYSLHEINSTENLIGTPRDIKIGDSVESVLNKFPNTVMYDKKEDYYANMYSSILDSLDKGEKLLYYNGEYDSMGIIKYNDLNQVTSIKYATNLESGGVTEFTLKIKDNKVYSIELFQGYM